jgi:hypothetical protein
VVHHIGSAATEKKIDLFINRTSEETEKVQLIDEILSSRRMSAAVVHAATGIKKKGRPKAALPQNKLCLCDDSVLTFSATREIADKAQSASQ